MNAKCSKYSKKLPTQQSILSLNILVANGVNLDLLGQREPAIYGHITLSVLESILAKEGDHLADYYGINLVLDFFQTNHEGLFLDKLSGDYHGILLNPGAWTHTSLALGDRLSGLGTPYIEVHLSNIHAREQVRKQSFTAASAEGVIAGLGVSSYVAALFALLGVLTANPAPN